MRKLEARDRLARLEDTLRDALQEVRGLKEEIEQLILEEGAMTVNYGDPEPDVPAGGKQFRGQGGVVWYRTLLDGWRWDGVSGECRFGTPWWRVPEEYFPMQELVGTQLKGTRGWRRGQ